MYQHLCVAEHCGTPNQHGGDCPGDGCRGCLPRQAADGLRLCVVDTRRLVEDARTAAILHEDLALTLIRRGRGGEKVAGSSSGAPVPDDEVMEARTAIKATLVSLCRVIFEERGIGRPSDEVPAMGEYVARHATWLAAHPAADEHARDLRDVAGDPRTRRLAYPAGTDRLYIGDCPLEVTAIDPGPHTTPQAARCTCYAPARHGHHCGRAAGVTPTDSTPPRREVCGTRLYQYADQHLITCSGCETGETVEWWQSRICGDAAATVDAYAGAADLAMRWRREVTPAKIRQWASLGKVMRVGKDERGRTLYDLAELRTYADKLWSPVECASA